MRINSKLWFWVSFSLIFCGCATKPFVSRPQANMPGIYHRVERGQTLWKISKIYNVDLDEIVRINHILDVSRIEVGQSIFIPSYSRVAVSSKILATSNDDFIWPIKGKVIASFGQTYNNMLNKGINIRVRYLGDVFASRSGKVVFLTNNFRGFGKALVIDHGDGFLTVYTGVREVSIKVGDYVQKNTAIAKVGSSKNKDTYLHFEIRKNHIPQNPYFYLP